MAELDLSHDLAAIADDAALQSQPLPAEDVRRLGTRRRHRRHLLTSVAAVAVLLVGGVTAASQVDLRTDRSPNPVATPVASPAVPSPTPTVSILTEANLITASDLGTPLGGGRIAEWTANARPDDQISVCQQPGAALPATSTLRRNFAVTYPGAPTPTGPLAGAPSIYTEALQFADEPAARRGLQRYKSWVASCDASLATSAEYARIGEASKTTWIAVRANKDTVGEFTQVPTYRIRGDSSEDGFFETVGLTRVGDRLMVTVDLTYGNEKHTSFQQGGDPDSGMGEDIQFNLVRAAAEHLAR